MQALLEIITGLLAAMAALVLAQFGLDLDSPRNAPTREVHRTHDCAPEPSTTLRIAAAPARDC